jgi:hypothetical protein
MSVSEHCGTAGAGTGARPRTVAYQPKSRILILEFPREGAYLYHNVPVSAYERLKRSPCVHAAFVGGRRHRYSFVTTC